MRKRPLIAVGIAAAALVAPAAGANAPNTALVVTDPAGDANFSGVHGGAVPIPSQGAQDLVTATLDTNKVASKIGRRTIYTPTAVKFVLGFAENVSTAPGSSYGFVAMHSACGQMRIQVFYTPLGLDTYGDLADCGEPDPTTGDTQFAFSTLFTPKVAGKTITIELPLKVMPKNFKAGTALSEILAYSTHAEPVFGYQPADFSATRSAVVDQATSTKAWKIQ